MEDMLKACKKKYYGISDNYYKIKDIKSQVTFARQLQLDNIEKLLGKVAQKEKAAKKKLKFVQELESVQEGKELEFAREEEKKLALVQEELERLKRELKIAREKLKEIECYVKNNIEKFMSMSIKEILKVQNEKFNSDKKLDTYKTSNWDKYKESHREIFRSLEDMINNNLKLISEEPKLLINELISEECKLISEECKLKINELIQKESSKLTIAELDLQINQLINLQESLGNTDHYMDI